MSEIWALVLALWPPAMALALGVAAETALPWRPRRGDVLLRWLHAVVLAMSAFLLVAILFPAGQVGLAIWVEAQGWSLAAVLPWWLAVVLGVLLIDLLEWVSHWAEHRLGPLWRVHAVHHSDEVIDTSTALRFHPAEVIFRYGVISAGIVLAGLPAASAAAYGVLALVFNVWEHANLRLPRRLAPLGRVLITPDLHRLHHSEDPAHHDRNFGVVLSVWDRLFGTYLPAEALGEDTRFGLGAAQTPRYATLGGVLGAPFGRR